MVTFLHSGWWVSFIGLWLPFTHHTTTTTTTTHHHPPPPTTTTARDASIRWWCRHNPSATPNEGPYLGCIGKGPRPLLLVPTAHFRALPLVAGRRVGCEHTSGRSLGTPGGPTSTIPGCPCACLSNDLIKHPLHVGLMLEIRRRVGSQSLIAKRLHLCKKTRRWHVYTT